MRAVEKQKHYWQQTLILTSVLLLVWFMVTFVVSYFARELAAWSVIGLPLGFYMGAQGAPLLYLLIIWCYARFMNQLDRRYGVNDADLEE